MQNAVSGQCHHSRQEPHPMKSEVLDLPSLSVIVTTYNRADYLQICLACLGAQDYEGRWQIVVADDGSTDHTADVVADARRNAALPDLDYVRQEHTVFRKARILNKASLLASGDLLVFLDCDCQPAANLLSVYGSHAAPDSYYLGDVFFLNQQFSQAYLQNCRSFSHRDFFARVDQRQNQTKGSAQKVFKRYWKSRLYTALNIRRAKIWGGNLAVNRDVFEKINGFDGNYVRFGQEDSDLRNRLMKGSYRAVCLHTKARAYHLWHPRSDWRVYLEARNYFDHKYYKRPDLDVVCKNGLKQLQGRSKQLAD